MSRQLKQIKRVYKLVFRKMPETGIGGVILLWGLYDPTENYEECRLGMIVRRTGPHCVRSEECWLKRVILEHAP